LCTSEHADWAMRYVLWTPRDRGARLWAGSRVLAPAAIATLPKMGAPHGQLRPAGRGGRGRRARCAGDGAAAVGRQFPPAVAMARRLVPQTAEVLAQHLTAGPRALRPTIAPAEA
ncbi:MAG TPA: DUF2236 domain-containing protein, partial [Mycobacterium sp.]